MPDQLLPPHYQHSSPPTRIPDRSYCWRAKTVVGLLSNLKYIGYQVSHHCDHRGGVRPVLEWACSEHHAHHGLVSPEMFWAAQKSTPTTVRAWRHRLLATQGRCSCA